MENGDTLDIHYFFSGGFLLPNALVSYGLYIYAGDGKKRKYRLCPYFLRCPELAQICREK